MAAAPRGLIWPFRQVGGVLVPFLHPISLVQNELEDLFLGSGFQVLQGPEVETEFFNFDALNIPRDHPARDTQDTFWLENGRVLRTHTSANQVRVLKEKGVPIRAIFPGRCFRYEAMDASHENNFTNSKVSLLTVISPSPFNWCHEDLAVGCFWARGGCPIASRLLSVCRTGV